MAANDVVVVDEQDRELEVATRARAHAEGLLHRVACVYVFDDSGSMLIQERMNGQLDHSSAGHVDPGESYLVAARRELEEEIGIRGVDLSEIGTAISEERSADPVPRRHYFMIYRCVAVPGQLQPDEVKSVFWADPDETWTDIQRDPDEKKYTGGFKATLAVILGVWRL